MSVPRAIPGPEKSLSEYRWCQGGSEWWMKGRACFSPAGLLAIQGCGRAYTCLSQPGSRACGPSASPGAQRSPLACARAPCWHGRAAGLSSCWGRQWGRHTELPGRPRTPHCSPAWQSTALSREAPGHLGLPETAEPLSTCGVEIPAEGKEEEPRPQCTFAFYK